MQIMRALLDLFVALFGRQVGGVRACIGGYMYVNGRGTTIAPFK